MAKELNKNGMKMSLDPTGIYTDSTSFIDEIPECTNISVGWDIVKQDNDKNRGVWYFYRLAKVDTKVKNV